jgi:hypothetical protein
VTVPAQVPLWWSISNAKEFVFDSPTYRFFADLSELSNILISFFWCLKSSLVLARGNLSP